jgi:predicted ATPase
MPVCLAMGPGSTVAGRYLVESLAGEGGMGRVYRAKDLTNGALVALKVLGDHGKAERVAVEVDAIAMLDHPAVVRYVGHGILEDGEPFLVMEWLEGETLDERIHRKGLTLLETLALAGAVVSGLDYIHGSGVIHRDLKPANLMLPSSDVRSVKIVDFGIARVAHSRALTGTGIRVGTLYYMAPEQYSHPRLVDGRADVFALGCILFECLTGQRAFEADDDMAAFARVVLEQAPLLRAVRPELPVRIEEFVGKLLTRDRTKRPLADAALLGEISSLATELRGADLERPAYSRAVDTPVRPGATFAASDVFSATVLGSPPGAAVRIASLPRPQYPITGRERELVHLAEVLAAAGGVFLLWGAAGIGKTRLALEVAQHWIMTDGTRGAAFAHLRQAVDADGALRAIALAIQPSAPPGGTSDEIEQAIGRILAARGAFALVLDGTEHVAAALEPILARWSAAAPDARLVVTSRQRGSVGVLVELGPLEADAVTAAAVRLFQSRAGAAAAQLASDPDALRLVLRIVRALDGNPLAIELAAARLEVLGLEALLERLSRPLELLGRTGSVPPMSAKAGASTPAPPLTMTEALAWSWDLLSPDEKLALASASVFRGSFTAQAAEAILGAHASVPVLDLLQSLRDKSLLASNVGKTSVEARLSMSSSVRDFARAKLAELGKSDEVHDRHARYFVGTCEPLSRRVALRGDVPAFRSVAGETDELLGAFEHALGRELPVALAALLALDPVLTTRGPFGKHREMLDLALARAEAEGALTPEVSWVRQARGRVLTRLGQHNGARADLERALEDTRRAGMPDAEASALLDLGVLHHAMRELDAARKLYEAVLLLDTDNPVAEARALGNLGALHHDALRFDDAYGCYVEAIALFESLGDPRPIGLFLANLAMLDFDRGRIPDAARRFGRALRHLEEARDPRLLAIALGSLGMLDLGEGRLEVAHGRFERAYALLQEATDPRSEALSLGRLSAVLACQGLVDEATAAIAKGERLARRDPVAKDTLRLFRAFLDAANAKTAIRERRGAEARAALESLRERIRIAGEPHSGERPLLSHSDDARAALRVLRPLLEKLEESQAKLEIPVRAR